MFENICFRFNRVIGGQRSKVSNLKNGRKSLTDVKFNLTYNIVLLKETNKIFINVNVTVRRVSIHVGDHASYKNSRTFETGTCTSDRFK